MKNIKQHLIKEVTNQITAKEQEIRESDQELEILNAELKVENTAFGMQDIKDHLKEDFKYSAQAIEGMLVQEQQRNTELKRYLEMLKYRKAVIESQFPGDELDR